jgi:hypothetical protein
MLSDSLHKQILRCHGRGEFDQLAGLYRQAGDLAHTEGRVDEACFHYTTAYVFALDSGDEALARHLHKKLVGFGREEGTGIYG